MGVRNLKLNLGSANRPIPGFVSVDIVPPADVIADLSQPWPWETSSIAEVEARDMFEHLPSRVFTMNELHRVLMPGAIATVEVPSATKGAGFVQDPTHVSPFCLNSFQYFEYGAYAHTRLAAAYGITAAFRIVSLTEAPYQDVHEQVWKITAVLKAVK